jgi:plasmid stabilization system protein ParE
MNAPLPVRIVSSAARSIEEAARWWSENRTNSPDAFVNDLENALKLIISHPEIGARARNVKLKRIDAFIWRVFIITSTTE